MADEVKEVKEEKEVKDVHEVHFVKDKGWAVQRQGSDKVIKYFKTKLEALEYVLRVSENRKTRVVIKRKDGKYQKFDSAVRALSYIKENKEDAE